VCIHRVKREFKSIHSENNFNLLKSSESGIEMYVSGKNDGDKYRVKNDCINMVYRKIHGTIIEIFVEEFFDTEIKWAHIDIAGTCWTDKNKGINPSGATGFGVKTLVQWIKNK